MSKISAFARLRRAVAFVRDYRVPNCVEAAMAAARNSLCAALRPLAGGMTALTLLVGLLFILTTGAAWAKVPAIACPFDIVTNNAIGQCSAIVGFAPDPGGSPPPAVTCTPASGSAFAV